MVMMQMARARPGLGYEDEDDGLGDDGDGH